MSQSQIYKTTRFINRSIPSVLQYYIYSNVSCRNSETYLVWHVLIVHPLTLHQIATLKELVQPVKTDVLIADWKSTVLSHCLGLRLCQHQWRQDLCKNPTQSVQMCLRAQKRLPRAYRHLWPLPGSQQVILLLQCSKEDALQDVSTDTPRRDITSLER